MNRRHFIAATSALATPVASAQAQGIPPGDESAIWALVQRYMDAREAKDPEAIGRLFTADADQLVSDGTWRRGRDELVKGMLESSAKNPAKRTITVESVRLLAPGLALVDGRYVQKGSAGAQDREMWTAITAKREADGWRIAAIRNMLPVAAPKATTPEADPQTVLGEAQELAGQGKYEEALQKHLWFHENAVRIQPSMSAVRLSFALSYWVKLGERYPKAREALVAIRDKDAAMMKTDSGTSEIFSETSSINNYLDQSSKTVELFKSIDAGRPKLANRCYFYVEETLAEAGEYALCSKHIPDPEARLGSDTTVYRMNREMERARPKDSNIHDISGRMFVESSCRLIKILVGAGRKPEAEIIRRKALEIHDDPRIRDAIAETGAKPGKP